MSDPRDTDPRRNDVPRQPNLEGQSTGGSMWPWLAGLIVVLAVIGMSIAYNRTEQASGNQSNAPTTTGAAPSESRPAPPANPGGTASRPTPAVPATPAPNEGPR